MRSSLYGAAVVLVLLSPWAMASAADGRRYDSIFCFGDSFTDTGNNPAVFAWYSVVDPVTRPPYGSSFFGHPTGRNCDGRLIIDFIAEGLGLPYVPPYLGPPGFRQGASLAVGAATAIDVGFFHERGLVPAPSKFPLNTSLTVQLQWFDSLLKPTLCGTTQECADLFGRSLFFVGELGVNDYLFSIGKMTAGDIISSIVPSVIGSIRQAIERLIEEHGAKTLVLPGVIPLGCSPPVIDMFADPDPAGYDSKTGCMLKNNEIAQRHNTLLQQSLVEIRGNHPGVNIIYADFFTPVMEMVESPTKSGFRDDVLTVCCGGPGPHNFNITVPCGDAEATTCSQPSASIFWDGVHFTEAANRHIASSWMSSIIN
ncbi:hypothetical protein HU200_066701 [Digitaria exilis]|uniref:GDSL esterase/lipase n=1 Tax=Digitaria exilis TaxID=1010633 RepID=A0A834ZWN3_9POAL|nr:hypothetical protein HU200_066701 [Digitaria exilis]